MKSELFFIILAGFCITLHFAEWIKVLLFLTFKFSKKFSSFTSNPDRGLAMARPSWIQGQDNDLLTRYAMFPGVELIGLLTRFHSI